MCKEDRQVEKDIPDPFGIKVRPLGLPYKTKPEIGLELISMTHSWLRQGERLRVVADLGYCCETILKGRPEDVYVTGRIRMDASFFAPVQTPAIRRRGRPRKRGCRPPTPAAMLQGPNLKWSEIRAFCYEKEIRLMVHQFTALWYHSAGHEAVSIVLCHD